jgi:glycerol-3-phosphate O-acyltransferase
VIGEPFPLAPWLGDVDQVTGGIFGLARADRLAYVQSLADSVLARIAAIVPVTPVTLACAALQSFDEDFVSHRRLIGRMAEMRDVLRELNARVIHREGGIDEIFDRAWRMLQMRRILVRVGDGYAILPGNRPLLSYYANSIGHLLGPFAEGVRQRDRLPALEAGLLV